MPTLLKPHRTLSILPTNAPPIRNWSFCRRGWQSPAPKPGGP